MPEGPSPQGAGGPDDDALLMARTARGDTAAFADLVRRHQARVFSLAYRSVGNTADAEDVVQEVLLRVYRAAGRYVPTARFTTWLYRVATNVIINALKRERRRPAALGQVVGQGDEESLGSLLVDPAGEGGLAAAAQDEMRANVRRAIEGLPPNQRLAVLLFRFEGQSYQAIAEILSCSVMAVKSLLSRARENLRQRLKPYLEGKRAFSPKLPAKNGG